MARRVELGDVSVDVVFKDIKNVHLSVYPPTGRVTVSAPSRMTSIRSVSTPSRSWAGSGNNRRNYEYNHVRRRGSISTVKATMSGANATCSKLSKQMPHRTST